MQRNPFIRFLIKFYGCVLWLYPTRFRAKFGPEMLDVFRQAAEEASSKGIFSLVRLMLGELSGLLPALLSLREWKGDGIMEQKAEKLQPLPVTKLSSREIMLGMLPLIGLGLSTIISSMPTFFNLPDAVIFSTYMLPYLVVMVGILWGWKKGFPRWVYPYPVYAITGAFFFSLSTQPSYKIWIFDLWDWIPFVPLEIVIILALLFVKSPFQALVKMGKDVWKDWTLLVYGLYGLLPIIIPISQDETDRSYRFPVTVIAMAIMLVGGILYVGITRFRFRTTLLLGGLFLSFSTATVGSEFYWKTHDINIITHERHLIAGPVPWGDILSHSIPVTVVFTLMMLLLPGLVGILHWLINTRRPGTSGGGAG